MFGVLHSSQYFASSSKVLDYFSQYFADFKGDLSKKRAPFGDVSKCPIDFDSKNDRI